MIKVTRLDGAEFAVNSDLILFVEATPDTVIRLTTGDRILVREAVDEVIRRIAAFTKEIGSRPLFRPGVPAESTS